MSRLRNAALLTMAVLAVPALALAASPTKGGTYVGTKGGGTTSVQKKLSLKVSSSGKTATITVYCGTASGTSVLRQVAIRNGRFEARKHTGSITLWKLKGRFTSSTKATAYFNLVSYCDGKSDGTVTLKLKTTP